MSPKKLTTKPADAVWARGRRSVAEKYLEVADLAATEDGTAINVCVGLCVLSGIAAGDAICAAATGERYSGQDHSSAADLLTRVDARAGHQLSELVAMKTLAHYGERLLSAGHRTRAVRAATTLVAEARRRTT